MKFSKLLKTVSVLLLTFPFGETLAKDGSLKDILQYSLSYDPRLDEARANLAGAESQTKVSEAGHYPIVSLSNTQMVAQNNRYNSNRRSSGPGLNATLNLYAWGAIEAEIERDKHKQDYFYYKLLETREEVGRAIGELYLTALRAKENIVVYQESLQRHNKILRDLKVVAAYDDGRRSEVSEAESRVLQVEASIAQQEKTMYSALSKLSRYSKRSLSPEDLQDPFTSKAVNLISQYRNPDLTSIPTYNAQNKEFESMRSAVKAAEARRLPAINLESNVNRDDQLVYLNVAWDIYNPATKHNVAQHQASQAAADAKLREIELEVQEQAQTAEMDMLRNERLVEITKKQITAQKRVVQDYELQFQIAYRSLLDLLNSYQELSGIQLDEVAAKNDLRDATLTYLVSQARISAWAGVGGLNSSKAQTDK